MRGIALAAAVLGVAASSAAAQDDLTATFMRLQRSSSWQSTGEVVVDFPTYHPQGLAVVGDDLFVSSVEIIEPTERYLEKRDGYDRSAGKGAGHLFRMNRAGKLLGQVTLGEGDAYHPGGIDFDGSWLWVPVAEYRPDSASIIYRVDPATLQAEEVLRVKDHIGGIVHDTEAGTLNGVSWGSRRLYSWKIDAAGRVDEASVHRSANPSFYVDYQDCAYVGGGRALCSGVAEHRPDPAKPKWALGGLDLIDLTAGRPLHQVPVLLWTASGEAMTRNPVHLETVPGGLRALFMPEDERSTLYTYEVRPD